MSRLQSARGLRPSRHHWTYGVFPIALVCAACVDAPTAPSHAGTEQPLASLDVKLVPSEHSVAPIGFLPGGSHSYAYGINRSGFVVGYSGRLVNGEVHARAFLYLGGSVPLQDLGTLPGDVSSDATAINDAGQVAGTSTGPKSGYTGSTAFRYSPGTGMESIAGNNQCNPMCTRGKAINSAGNVVGGATGGAWLAFGWTPESGLELFPQRMANAADINDAGIIVGNVGYGDSEEAYVWTGTSSFSLGTLGGSGSWANAINNSPPVWIVGTSKTASGESHGFIWTFWFGLQDMGPLSSNYSAVDVSDKGRVVGTDNTLGRAYTFYQREFSYLPSLIEGGAAYATAVNACGTIVGYAEYAPDRWVAVRWDRYWCDA